MTREEILMLLSRMQPQDIDLMRSILLGEESGKDTGMGDVSEIGFDITRTVVTEGEEPSYFVNKRTDIIEDSGRLGRIKELKVWDCGHSQYYPFGGIDSFGHTVCKHCIRWCDRGQHTCCVLDSKLLRSGKRACDYHRGLNRILRPAFKREINK